MIYFDCRQIEDSGIGTYISNLVDSYAKQQHQLEIKLLIRKSYLQSARATTSFSIRQFDAPIYSITEQLTALTKVPPGAIFHAPHYNAPLLYPGKLIVTVHDVCHLAMGQYFSGKLKRVYARQFLRLILKRAVTIITVSEFSKAEIIRYFNLSGDKIAVIYNGVSQTFRPCSEEEKQRVSKKNKLPHDFLLYLGNVKPHKNIKGLVTGYKRALQEKPDLPPLVVLGEYRNLITGVPELKQLLDDPLIGDKLIFTGHLPDTDLPAIYSQALIFLFPSFYEGFGLPPLEAMACGTPVITSNCSALPEIVGDAALLINPYHPAELAYTIIELLEDSEKQNNYITKGLQKAKSYSWQNSAQKHLEIYKHCSGEG